MDQMVKHLINRGIGFGSGSFNFIVTLGLSPGAALIAALGSFVVQLRRRAYQPIWDYRQH